MECLFATIVLLAIVVAFLAQKWGNASGTNDAYARLANRLGGKVSRGGWFRKPSVRFVWHGAQVEVAAHSGKGSGSPQTEASITWPDAELSLEIYPAGVWSRVSRLLGSGSMQIGEKTFDEHFVINTNSPEGAARFLSAGVQWHIDRLCRLFGSGEVYLLLAEGRLTIRKKQQIRTHTDLDQFVRLCLELYEQAVLTRSEGIAFVAGEAPLSPPKCLVCGEGVIADVVLCRRCQTPHHKECWNYNGCCATYGCGETRFDQPRAVAVRSNAPPTTATRR